MSTPLYGQRSDPLAAPECPRHPGVRSVDYCKKCNRPMCVECRVPTEVRAVCVECASAPRISRSASRPSVTIALISLCVALQLLVLVVPSVQGRLLFSPPLGLREPWRFLTTAFLHSGIPHLVLNMMALYWVGPSLERLFGHWRFAAIYLLSAIGGSAFVLLWVLIQPDTALTATVGASGAVFGLFGAIFIAQRESGMDTRSVLALLMVNMAYGFIVPNVSWQAHVGGLIAGTLLALLFIRQGRPRAGVTARKQQMQALWMTAGAFAALCALIGLIYRVIFEVLG